MFEMEYEWKKELSDYTNKENIWRLRDLVNEKRRKGQWYKWLIIAGDCLLIALVILFIGALNVLGKDVEPRYSLIGGIITVQLAVFTFYSPIKTSRIAKEEVDEIVGKKVTTDIMAKIRDSVEGKTSGIQRWIAAISALGAFASVVLVFTI